MNGIKSHLKRCNTCFKKSIGEHQHLISSETILKRIKKSGYYLILYHKQNEGQIIICEELKKEKKIALKRLEKKYRLYCLPHLLFSNKEKKYDE